MNTIVSELIDHKLWDKAKWRGVGYMWFDDLPPVFGLYFENLAGGEAIFHKWKTLLGDSDHDNQLRITLVEGTFPKAFPGYNIRIGANVPAILDLAKRRGENIENTAVLYTSRIHRMNPPPKSNNLRGFKAEYEKHRTFSLVQVAPDTHGSLLLNQSTRIDKTDIYFRQLEDILEGDIDRDAIIVPPE